MLETAYDGARTRVHLAADQLATEELQDLLNSEQIK